MNKSYTLPTCTIEEIHALQMLCESSKGWAEMGSYGENTGGGFHQAPPF